ncbi:hypothetical protein BJ741DRAFT_653441 [Chytriomyces cf. hyalinus JEL632]|nr:hypothetical protein BJ741DRAFT_653441 [Chytriomyces cf. hyalinus JEL632]
MPECNGAELTKANDFLHVSACGENPEGAVDGVSNLSDLPGACLVNQGLFYKVMSITEPVSTYLSPPLGKKFHLLVLLRPRGIWPFAHGYRSPSFRNCRRKFVRKAVEDMSAIIWTKDDGPNKQTIYSAKDSQDAAPMDYTSDGNILNLKMEQPNGSFSLLSSEQIYEDENSIGINMSVEKLLRVIRKTIILVGVSGCGKTRTCYDFVRHRWCLYIDCIDDSDVKEMIKQLEAEASKRSLKQLEYLFCKCGRWKIETLSNGFAFNEIFEDLKSQTDFWVIFNESQYLLGILPTSYRSDGEKRGIFKNQLEHPRSLFSFATGFMINEDLKSIWCGTKMRIGTIELISPSAGLKPDQYFIFTDFTFLTASDIFKLCSKWLRQDVFDANIPSA